MQHIEDTSSIQPISNEVFLKAIFGNKFNSVHTCSFPDDPYTVKPGRWKGTHYDHQPWRYDELPIESWDNNNYFVISLFSNDEQQKPRRQKHLFEHCHLVVIDDVHSKVPVEKLKELGFPEPSYKMETSPGNEQWGYLFDKPVDSRMQIEHLLNSWVKLGISCDGKDPGMKGVTRYVRLPVGSNTKKLYGKPFRHRMVEWNPQKRIEVELLAACTGVDLSQAAPDQEDRAQEIIADDEDPMLIALSDAGLLQRKTKPGYFDITCPWIDGHSARADTGTAYIQPAGFRCHHGSCDGRNGRDLRLWLRKYGHLKTLTAEEMFGEGPDSEVLAPAQEVAQLGSYCYISELDKFFERRTGLYHGRDKMNETMATGDDDPKYCVQFFQQGIQRGGFNSFVSQTYVPGASRVIVDNRGEHLNMWEPGTLTPIKGDVERWLELGRRLIPEDDEFNHVIRWMAQTVQHPGKKINHCLLITGEHGTGKDSFIEPLIHAVGKLNWRAISATEMDSDFNGYVTNKKLLVFNEITNLRGKRELEQRLKPLLAAPPDMLAINRKYMPIVEVPNLVNTIMFSNEGHQSVSVSQGDRRYFCIQSPAKEMGIPEAVELWNWYLNDAGLEKVYQFLLSVDVTKFNPKAPPPMTTFKEELVEASRTGLEVELEDVINENPKNWVAFKLDRMMLATREAHPGKQIGSALRKLGYTTKSAWIGGKTVRIWFRKEFSEVFSTEWAKEHGIG